MSEKWSRKRFQDGYILADVYRYETTSRVRGDIGIPHGLADSFDAQITDQIRYSPFGPGFGNGSTGKNILSFEQRWN